MIILSSICLRLLAFIKFFVYNIEKRSVMNMANTSAVYALIDTELKEKAESRKHPVSAL